MISCNCFSSGFTLGAMNTWASGGSFMGGLNSGLKGGLIGGGTGAITGGISRGIHSAKNGGNFFTGKGYSQISEFVAVNDDYELGGDRIMNRVNFKNIKDELNWEPGKLGVNKMEIEGDIMSRTMNSNYFRTNEGIITRLVGDGTTYQVRGFVDRYQASIMRMNTDMYLSSHKTFNGLRITINHELIHAYHYSLGLPFRANTYSEYSAVYNTAMYLPEFSNRIFDLIQYRSAFVRGYGWPNYLLKIK